MLTGQRDKYNDANKQIKIKKSLWITASNNNDLIFDEDEGQLKVFSIVNSAVLSIWDILVSFYFLNMLLCFDCRLGLNNH